MENFNATNKKICLFIADNADDNREEFISYFQILLHKYRIFYILNNWLQILTNVSIETYSFLDNFANVLLLILTPFIILLDRLHLIDQLSNVKE